MKLPPEPARPFVKAYKLADLSDALEKGLKSGRDFDRGRKLFAAGKCFACHRFDNEGGSNGPGPHRRRWPVQPARPAGVDHRPEQGGQ